MKQFQCIPATLATLGVLVTSGAVLARESTPWIEETWNRQEGKGGVYSKVLVVAITTDAKVRRNFENKFVSHLRGRGIECITGHSIVPDPEEIGPASEIADRLLSLQVDAVITIRLAAPDSYAAGGAKLWDQELADEIRVRAYIESGLAAGTPKAKRQVVDVGLWDLTTRGRVWAARTAPHKLGDLRKRSGDIVQELILRLRNAALL